MNTYQTILYNTRKCRDKLMLLTNFLNFTKNMENHKKIYSKDLANRFVSDYKLPIQMTDEKYFFYYLDLYEKEYQSRTKYDKLCDIIEKEYDGSPNKFLYDYYHIRDVIITTVENSDAYKKFNEMDMSIFSIKDKLNITSNNIYNETNVGKAFISIDLKKANFQALKYVDPKIVLNSETYQEFIGNFTLSEYVAESKYTRQVIFGKLNPKRHIAVEKFITHKIYDFLKNTCGLPYKCVSISNDEIIFDLGKFGKMYIDEIFGAVDKANECEKSINDSLGFEVNVEMYVLHKVQLCCDKFKRSCYYYKEYITPNKVNGKLVCVPSNYFPIVYKLFNGLALKEEDYHFDYEGLDCKYCENFTILTDFKH